MNRVPIHTPSAPRARAAARPRPSKMPPAATTGMWAPTASTIWGTSGMVATRPVWPPASVPWATTTSHPASSGPPGVVHLAAHVDDQDVVAVTEVDHLRRHAQAGHEDRGASFDDLLDLPDQVPGHGGEQVDPERLVRRLAYLGDLGHHPLVGHGRGSEATESSGLGHRRHQGGYETPPMPANMTGWSIPSTSVSLVFISVSSVGCILGEP